MIPEHLLDALAEQQITVTESQHQALINYVDLMLKWNKTYNLTAIRNRDEFITKHLIDSLVVVPYLPKGHLLDVGSGGGLPGIPVAILCPDLQVTMIDTVGKKTTFLRQAAIELGLQNISVVHSRVEKWSPPRKFEAIISRAFASIADFVTLSSGHLEDDGKMFAMKGLHPTQEIEELPLSHRVTAEHVLQVPGLEANRYLIEICSNE